MGLLEAAAAGLAILCTEGPGMEHVGELLVEGEQALFVSNALPLQNRIAAFAAAVEELIHDGARRCRMGTCNRERAISMLRRRNAQLLAIYEAATALHVPGGGALQASTGFAISTWNDRTCRWQRNRLAARLGARIRL